MKEIEIDETMETITFKVKKVIPPEYETQLEMLEATGLFDNIEGFRSELNFRELDLDMILEETCRYVNVDKSLIPLKSRKRELVAARYYYALLSLDIFRDRDDITLSKIGSLIGRDHSSVLHYKKEFNGKTSLDAEHNLKTSEKDKLAIKVIKEKLNGHLKDFQSKVKGVEV